MTLPFGDWPHLQGAPTEAQLAEVRDLYHREAARLTVAAMRATLRHLFDDEWRLELVGERDGEPVTYFSEDITATAGAERDAAVARLIRSGREAMWNWTQVDGGWDGQAG